MKENLILVPGFATNRKILAGLVEYLDRLYNVYFLDLPGFAPDVPPLIEIDYPTLSRDLHRRIQGLGLDNYWIGGASFGFYMVSGLPPDPHCKGVLAIEPFTGAYALRGNPRRKKLYSRLIDFFGRGTRSQYVWQSRVLKEYLQRSIGLTDEVMAIVLDEFDPRSVFGYLRLIFNAPVLPGLLDLPHILIMAKDDGVIDFSLTEQYFQDHCPQVRFLNIEMEHFPTDTSAAYFERTLGSTVEKMSKWINYPWSSDIS